MRFLLKHKNNNAALLDINTINGKIEHAEIINSRFLPFLGTADVIKIRKWWQIRGITTRIKDYKELLAKKKCVTSEQYMIKNLALSVSDTYWLCPVENTPLTWEKVNVFQNNRYDPNSTLNASSIAKWIKNDGVWKLYKEDEHNGQESVNEEFARLLHSRQGKVPFVSYNQYFEKNKSGSMCRAFTSPEIELISAYEVTLSTKQNNSMSDYEHFIRVCVEHGLDECYVRNVMDYMVLTDFLLTNVDRHYCNFGVLRDTTSMKIIVIAPLFDYGNSMFYAGGEKRTRSSLLETAITGMAKTEEKMLKFVSDPKVVNLNVIPSPNDVLDFYMHSGISEEHAEMIAHNYQIKRDIVFDMQKGNKVSIYYEKRKKKHNKNI